MRFFLKAGGLLLILALPVLIYVFLQTFGENKYDLPIYYENGVDTLITGCNFNGEGQYKIPERYFKYDRTEAITIVFFRPSGVDLSEPVIAGLARTMNVFKESEVKLLVVSGIGQANFGQLVEKAVSYGNNPNQWALFTAKEEQLLNTIVCDFVIPTGQSSFPLLLVDKEGRIRGYYHGMEREEVDRLIVEINILLEKDKG